MYKDNINKHHFEHFYSPQVVAKKIKREKYKQTNKQTNNM